MPKLKVVGVKRDYFICSKCGKETDRGVEARIDNKTEIICMECYISQKNKGEKR